MSLFSFLLILLSTLLSRASSRDTITPTTPITDVTQTTLVSANGVFELGFFSPRNSKNRYLGIWYKNIPPLTVVWVANRAKPITDSTGILNISTNGNLVLLNATSTVFWSSPASANYTTNPTAQLLESGNFILRESSTPAGFLWQSFDYPTDTLLAGMKLGVNLKTGLNRYLTSWETANNPYLGEYSLKMDLEGVPEIYIYRGLSKIYTGGPWNGIQFSGVPDLKSDDIFNFSFIINTNEVYYTYEMLNQSITSNLILNNNGKLDRRVWLGNEKGWQVFWSDPKTDCDDLAKCGPFGFCINSDGSPICNCLHGFVPKSEQEWKFRDGSGGCLRTTKLACKGDGFLLKHNMKLPVSINATVNTTMSLEDCREMCLKNCYCTAYASSNILGGGSGCFTWIGELINLQEFEDGGQDLYIRLAASELVSGNTKVKISHKNRLVAIFAPITSVLLLFGLVGFCFCIKIFKVVSLSPHTENDPILFLAKNVRMLDSANIQHIDSDQENGKDLELKLFEMTTIMAATEGFAHANKLGEGGFGPVYKGTLGEGQDIAVKRLSNDSSQGLDEFKNEVILIAKLQHRNLVRLLGCCIDGDERMLIYEFMHNRSLDTFIFDAAKRTILNWQRRFDIISGIARGLLYLHQDSRLRIIHRDIKSSNVLLDADMNPKISDFGIARIFGGNQTDAYTTRVVGTYGYMAPEYAADGVFSVKSDVFSFGVLVLEIVSGKKNKGFYQLEPHLNLLRHTWRLWNEGKILELVDESLDGSYISSEVLRCIQVGLLCVQERAIDRPLMSSVTMMLGSETMMLPEPNEPGFVSTKISIDTKSSSGYTMNDVTMTRIDAR